MVAPKNILTNIRSRIKSRFVEMKMGRYKLGDICEIVSGSTPKTGIAEYWDGDVKWITPAEINEDSYIVMDSARKITELAVNKTGLTPFPAGTVILSSRAPIGKVAIAGCEMYCNQGFKNLICSEKINNRYLYWFLKGNTDFLNSLGRGATFKEISKQIVANVELNVPEYEKQLIVVAHLEKVNEIIKLRKQKLAKLDKLIKSRFVELFGDPVTNEKNWPRLTLGDICEIGSSKRVFEKDYVSQGIPFFRTKEIVELSKGNSISTELFITEEHFAELKKSYGAPKKDDLLISAVGTIGTIWIISGDFEFYFKDGNLIQVKSSPNFNSIFMKYLLDELIANYKKEMSTGTAYSALTIAGLKKMLVYDVPLVFQEEFATFVEQVDKLKVPEIHLKLTLYYLQYKYKKRRSTDVQF